MKVQGAADHQWLAVQENYFSSYSSHRIFKDKAKENCIFEINRAEWKNFSLWKQGQQIQDFHIQF